MKQDSSRYETSTQKISLQPIETQGRILDIGGGGEGLVSRIEGANVCAVDIRLSEIREAQIHNPPANWFVGDGRNLCFRDAVFDVVTLWFSLGYMREWPIKERVIAEAYRVLESEGRISILGSKITENSDHHIFWAHFTLPDGTISKTGYGVMGNQNQTQYRVSKLLEQVGFVIQIQEDNGDWFKLEAIKP
jgi:ubiquinone/menaquinone biosynthesis C-methylase UbiE